MDSNDLFKKLTTNLSFDDASKFSRLNKRKANDQIGEVEHAVVIKKLKTNDESNGMQIDDGKKNKKTSTKRNKSKKTKNLLLINQEKVTNKK